MKFKKGSFLTLGGEGRGGRREFSWKGEEKSLSDNTQYLMILFRDVQKFDHLQSEKDNLKHQIAYLG